MSQHVARIRRTLGFLIAPALAAIAFALPASAPAAGADTVHIRGVAYAFFGIDDHMPGAIVRIEEYPGLSAPVQPDGSYDIEVPDDANVTPYIDPPPGYRTTYLQTFHTSGEDLEAVHFQVTPDLYYLAFAGLLSVPLDDHQTLEECAIVSTFSIHEARDATEFDPGFKDVYPHGLPGSTATIDPSTGNTRGPIYFNSSVVPDVDQTSSSVDGGVLWVEVPPGWYRLTPSNPDSEVAPFLAHCENGRLVNASPPWGFYELKPGEEPDPAVLADPPDRRVAGRVRGDARVRRQGDRRVVRVRFRTDEPTDARLRVFRGDERLGASPDVSLRPGKHRLQVRIRRAVRSGPATARLRLRDEAGNRHAILREVRIPR
ncbi:MAG: hypothetical protein R2718_04160 [Solirubrobacterales bacterium]|nr:hypothetical protein [Solirubrobacterales bacterium]